MIIPLFDIEDSPPIVLKVFDDDTFGSDFIGGAIVDITKGLKEGFVKLNTSDVPDPKWVQLKYSNL